MRPRGQVPLVTVHVSRFTFHSTCATPFPRPAREGRRRAAESAAARGPVCISSSVNDSEAGGHCFSCATAAASAFSRCTSPDARPLSAGTTRCRCTWRRSSSLAPNAIQNTFFGCVPWLSSRSSSCASSCSSLAMRNYCTRPCHKQEHVSEDASNETTTFSMMPVSFETRFPAAVRAQDVFELPSTSRDPRPP